MTTTSCPILQAVQTLELSTTAGMAMLVLQIQGDAGVTKQRLARLLLISEHLAAQSLKELEEKGVAQAEPRGAGRGRARSYRLAQRALERPAGGDDPAASDGGRTTAGPGVTLPAKDQRPELVDDGAVVDAVITAGTADSGQSDGSLEEAVKDVAGVEPSADDLRWLRQLIRIARDAGVFTGRVPTVGVDTPLRRSRDREAWKRVRKELAPQDEELLESLDAVVDPGDSPRTLVHHLGDWSAYRVCGLLLVLDQLFLVSPNGSPSGE